MIHKLIEGTEIIYKNCVCGDGGLTSGNTYKVIAVKYPLFMFLDDKGSKRIRNINSRCFSIVQE